MRGIGIYALLGLALFCAGCGGGGGERVRPRVIEGDLLRVSYLYWLYTLPQAKIEEFYEVQAHLWLPQSSPQLSAMSLRLPDNGLQMPMRGPQLPANTGGIYQGSVPLLVYWGTGEKIGGGQPEQMAPGDWLPGYVIPPTDLYVYRGKLQPAYPLAVAGDYRITAADSFARTWTVPAGQRMLPAARITSPDFIAVNSSKPIEVSWEAVPGAAGYLVMAEGDMVDRHDTPIAHVVWTSANTAVTFDALYDVTDLLLPAETRALTIPAHTFAGVNAITLTVLAQAAPYIDETQTPKLRLLSYSLSSQLFALFAQ